MVWEGVAAGAAGSLVNNLLGGGGSKSHSTQVTPWKPAKPHLMNVLGGARDLYNQGAYSPEFSAQSQNALNMMESYANTGGQGIQDAIGYNNALIRGDYLSPDSNPYLSKYADQLAGKVRSNVDSVFSRAGRSGSGAHGDMMADKVSNALIPLYNQAYNTERGYQNTGAANAQAFYNAGLAPANTLLGVGGAYEDMAQQQYNAPWQHLQNYQNVAQGVGGMGQTNTQPIYRNKLAEGLGAGMMGMSLWNQFNQPQTGTGSFTDYSGMGSPGPWNNDPYAGSAWGR